MSNWNYKKARFMVVFRADKYRQVEDIINECLNLDGQYYGERVDATGGITWIDDKYKLYQMSSPFARYKDFDTFLIALVSNGLCDIKQIGALIGHTSESGLIWSDYKDFSKDPLSGLSLEDLEQSP